jgi:hypothetical protein
MKGYDTTVPTANTASNGTTRDVVGNKNDTSAGTSLVAKLLQVLEDTEILLDHIHKEQKVYPTLADGVTVTGGEAAWTLGDYAVVVPASTITSAFDIHWVNIEATSVADEYELVLYSGSDGNEVEIGRCRFTRTSNLDAVNGVPMQTPVTVANAQIKAKLASDTGGSDTATISVCYHVY